MDNEKDKELELDDGCCGSPTCGCDHSNDEDYEEEDIMYLTLDDDTELECNVLGIFEVEGKEYIALVPIDEDEALIYEYIELEDEDFDLNSIENEEEFNLVSEAFHALFAEEDAEYGTYEESEGKE